MATRPRAQTETTLWHQLTDAEPGAAGRRPDALAVRLAPAEAGFFPAGRFGVTTDDLRRFEASVAGTGGAGPRRTTLRSVPAGALGAWVQARKHAKAGDWLEFNRLPNGRLLTRFHPTPP